MERVAAVASPLVVSPSVDCLLECLVGLTTLRVRSQDEELEQLHRDRIQQMKACGVCVGWQWPRG